MLLLMRDSFICISRLVISETQSLEKLVDFLDCLQFLECSMLLQQRIQFFSCHIYNESVWRKIIMLVQTNEILTNLTISCQNSSYIRRINIEAVYYLSQKSPITFSYQSSFFIIFTQKLLQSTKTPPHSQPMSTITSSQINSKRQQFRNQIRRKELDDYRRRKRQQYFGYVPGTKKSCIQSEHGFMQKVPKQFQQLVIESPYPFNMEFKTFFVEQFETRLKENRFSIEVMNYVLDELVKFNLRELANSDKFNGKSMFSVVRMLNTMMTKVCEIPRNSILRVEKHQLIEQIYQKVFYSLKTILNGMITEQYHQEQQWRKYKNRLKLHQNIKNKKTTQIEQVKRQKTLQNLSQLIQYPPSINHPLQNCIKQVSQLLQSFCTLYHQTQLQYTTNSSTLLSDTLSLHLQYYCTMWYLMSFTCSSLFTQQLFAFYQGQLNTFKEFSNDMIDMLINTISNFIFNETDPHSNNQQGIHYDSKLVQASFAIFQGCLSAYDFSSTTLMTLVKTMTYAIIRRKAFCHLVLESTIFESCISIVRDSQQKLLNLAKQHVIKKTPHPVFQKQAQKINLLSIQRYQIYNFLGALFSSIQLQDLTSITIVRSCSQNLLQMIYFEYNKIILSQVKDKALIAAIELESPEQKERVVLAVLYLQFNLFSFNPEIIQGFIEQNVLMYVMGIWQHFSQLQESLVKHSGVINVIERLHSIKKIQYSLISAVWNIIVQFQFPQQQQLQREDPNKFKDRSQALQVITQFKQFGLIKMLVNYLKTVVYDTDSMNINKDTVKFALHSLRRFFKFILFSSSQEHLCQCLTQSQTQVSIVKQVLERMMHSEHIFEEQLTNKALKCLEMFEVIVQNANFNEDYECYERGYHEQPYENNESNVNWNNYGNGNKNNNQGNHQKNQQNQGNWNTSYNQENQSNWSHNQNNQSWNQNPSEDIQI